MAGSGWMVITGGAAGVMGAGIEGAGTDSSFAALIRLPLEETQKGFRLVAEAGASLKVIVEPQR